jgi:HPt (histidine-containing phosphotransfer) domain-containing protein
MVRWVSSKDQSPIARQQDESENSGIGEYVLMNQHTLANLENETSREIATDIIGIFVRETGERVTALREAGRKQDFGSVVAEAHAIKSSAGTFGAQLLEHTAGRVELLGRQGKEAESIALIDSVEDIAQQTLQLYTAEYFGEEDAATQKSE